MVYVKLIKHLPVRLIKGKESTGEADADEKTNDGLQNTKAIILKIKLTYYEICKILVKIGRGVLYDFIYNPFPKTSAYPKHFLISKTCKKYGVFKLLALVSKPMTLFCQNPHQTCIVGQNIQGGP